ncbi:MAG: methylenetetrahydrofolate reductase [NAD(P)H] [Alphaproteobacteria bacterium]|nr:methylenetetrahydrofolate reductase [NAD(P)H] [Alphaproteobacteria bacterium]MBU2143693.1 methylenetetrahydrofolate reductase [NAD(P)H] [Alphaproteobacteria bacterium]MBU2195626.1 methylenetetrahydrofolate reductase [NAD(P)H] [Alphaproteobacteria bacterium]
MSSLSIANRQKHAAPTVSFEFFPPKTEAMATRLWETVQRLEPMAPEFVSVTYGAGGSTRERTHDTVKRIASDTALRPAAHLTCVSATKAEVLDVADSYAAAGVHHIVALRGDPPEGMGAAFAPHPDGFANSVELIEALSEAGKFEISVSCYPEPHPNSRGWDEDLAFLKAKQDAGAKRAITQFFFEPDTYLRFVEKARAKGITMPLVPGIMLQPNFAGLKRMASMVQATVPAWLDRLYDGLDSDDETRDLVTATVAAELCHKLADEGVSDFHFYTLNRAGLALSTCRLLGMKPKPAQAA